MVSDLVTLKIPSGWRVDYNVFTDGYLDEVRENVDIQDNKNLLFMTHRFARSCLELGRYTWNHKREFCLIVTRYEVETDYIDYMNPSFIFRSDDIDEIIAVLNNVICDIIDSKMQRDLIALKIPSGWYVDYNVFTKNYVDENVNILGSKSLVFLTHGFTKRIVELEWNHCQGKGEFCIIVTDYFIKTEHVNRENPLFIFTSKDITETITVLNDLLSDITQGRI